MNWTTWALICEAICISYFALKFLRMRRTRGMLANQLLRIMYETGGRKGVVSSFTMKQSAQVMAAAGILREKAK